MNLIVLDTMVLLLLKPLLGKQMLIVLLYFLSNVFQLDVF